LKCSTFLEWSSDPTQGTKSQLYSRRKHPEEPATGDLRFSLICILPPTGPSTPSWPSPNKKWIAIVHSLANEMICSSLESKEDHESINAAISIFPMLAIFMSVVVQQGKKKKASKKTQLKSILDTKDSTKTKCLAAVNYF
jgi:hypothetical protein